MQTALVILTVLGAAAYLFRNSQFVSAKKEGKCNKCGN
jgi:hypothetical protein